MKILLNLLRIILALPMSCLLLICIQSSRAFALWASYECIGVTVMGNESIGFLPWMACAVAMTLIDGWFIKESPDFDRCETAKEKFEYAIAKFKQKWFGYITTGATMLLLKLMA